MLSMKIKRKKAINIAGGQKQQHKAHQSAIEATEDVICESYLYDCPAIGACA